MFRAMLSPILRNTRLCVTACGIMHPWYCQPVAWKICFHATGVKLRGCIIAQAVTHSLKSLKMGEIIAWNILSWLELLISCYFCIYLVVYTIYINETGSSIYQNIMCVCVCAHIEQISLFCLSCRIAGELNSRPHIHNRYRTYVVQRSRMFPSHIAI